MASPSDATPCMTFLASLLGTWTGAGTGHFPTIKDFAYGTEQTFARVPVKTKAYFLSTSGQTWPPGKRGEAGMHFDSGFLRCRDANTADWALAHNFGATEMLVGAVAADGKSAVFKSTSIGNGDGETVATQREVRVAGAALAQDFSMATKSVPAMTHHLADAATRRD